MIQNVGQEGRGGGGQPSDGSVVTTSLLKEVVAELSWDARDITNEAVQMLDAFATP